MNRRTFHTTLLAAAAAGLASAATKLRIGIGCYTYHSLNIDAMIAELRAQKVTEIEMSRGEFMLFSKPPLERFETFKKKIDDAGIRCISYYTATIKDDTDLDNSVKFAKALGCNHITGDATGDILARMDKRYTTEGITFGIHNHFFKQKFAYESPEDILKTLANLSPTMGCSLDIGHIVSCGYDTVDAVRKLAKHIQLVHLKDIQAPGAEVNVPLGTGLAKIPAVMKELHRINFKGLVAFEYEKEGNINEDVARQLAYARKLA